VTTEVEKKIKKAKMQIYIKQNTTFFSALLASLRFHLNDQFPTAATNGTDLWVNPEFVKDMPVEEITFVLIHEVMHVVYEHMNRMQDHGLDQHVWNAAGDYLINGELVHLGYSMPQEGLYDASFRGKSTKEIYDILMAEGRVSAPQMLDLVPGPTDGKSAEEHKEAVINNIMKAATQAQIEGDAGSIPGHIQRIIEKLANPKLPWNVILQDHMTSYAKNDFSWKKPNRNYWPAHYLPTMVSENMDKLWSVIDVSGSISQDDLNAFMAEMAYIKDILNPKELRVLCFDTDIRKDFTVEEGELLERFELPGGGGTSIHPVIELMRQEGPDVAVIFTDLCFSKPYLADIGTDLFWVVKGGGRHSIAPSEGVVIQYDDD
jgi:predicted metal-dependent peptidase